MDVGGGWQWQASDEYDKKKHKFWKIALQPIIIICSIQAKEIDRLNFG